GLNVAINLLGTTNVPIGGNIFTANGTAINVNGAGARSEVLSNTFDGNTYSLAFATPDALFSAFPVSFDTNEFTGASSKNVVNIPSSYAVSGIIPPSPVPYFSFGVTLTKGNTLIVMPGTVFQLQSGYGVSISGDLIAIGSPSFPVVF